MMKEIEYVVQRLCEYGIEYRRNCSLKEYTTLHIGGAADILCEPYNVDEIIQCIQLAKQYQLPYAVLGNGSNVLAMDEGYQGMIILLSSRFTAISQLDATRVKAQAGASIKAVCAYCAMASLHGLEFACGIPGSVGGGVVMNAGAYDGEFKDVVEEVTYLDEHGRILKLKAEDLDFSYRHSFFSHKEGIVLEAVFRLTQGHPDEIQARMEELMALRRAKQPLDAYSAGSTFKRPTGNYASALIKEARLQGTQVGDACVSLKHAGFLINRGNATSKEFLQLIHKVQEAVKQHSGYELECEVKLLK